MAEGDVFTTDCGFGGPKPGSCLTKTFGDDAVRSMTRRYDYIKPLRIID